MLGHDSKSVILFFVLIISLRICYITRVERTFSHEKSEERGDINCLLKRCY